MVRDANGERLGALFRAIEIENERKTDVNRQEVQEMLQSFKGISEYIAEVSSRMAERMQPLIEQIDVQNGQSDALRQIADIQRKQQELDRQVADLKVTAADEEIGATSKPPRKYTSQHEFPASEPQSDFYAETPADKSEGSSSERWIQKYGQTPSVDRAPKPPRKMAMPRLAGYTPLQDFCNRTNLIPATVYGWAKDGLVDIKLHGFEGKRQFRYLSHQDAARIRNYLHDCPPRYELPANFVAKKLREDKQGS